jgi:hypothetical protein
VDAGGNAYITGSTFSRSDFPTTPGAFQPTSTAANECLPGAFAAKLNPAGSQLVYSTFFSWLDEGRAIAVDSNGQAYVTGFTRGPSGFPTTPGAFQTSSAGGRRRRRDEVQCCGFWTYLLHPAGQRQQ